MQLLTGFWRVWRGARTDKTERRLKPRSPFTTYIALVLNIQAVSPSNPILVVNCLFIVEISVANTLFRLPGTPESSETELITARKYNSFISLENRPHGQQAYCSTGLV